MPVRLHETDVNTPDYFNRVWTLENVHRFDTVRLNALAAPVKDGDRIIELGCGVYGFVQFVLETKSKKNIEGWGVDFSMVALNKVLATCPDFNPIEGNALETGILGQCFDVVGSGELIEHIEHPEDLVKEMNRLCKPGGFMVISTVDPDCEDAIRHGDYPEHLWRFTPDELKAYFAPYGAASYLLVGDYHVVHCKKSL